jgi:uncharacterized Zn finger protein
MENNAEHLCKECGWRFPEELMQSYLAGELIYCEKCGMENIIEKIPKKPKSASIKIKRAISSVKKKSVVFADKVKQKIKELKKKYDKD